MDKYYNISELNNCSNNGIIISNGTHGWCNCDIAYFNYNCSEKGIDNWNNAFLFYKILFTICYILIAGFTWIHLLKELLKVTNTNNRNTVIFVGCYVDYCRVLNTW
jgi:hypothetical protein